MKPEGQDLEVEEADHEACVANLRPGEAEMCDREKPDGARM